MANKTVVAKLEERKAKLVKWIENHRNDDSVESEKFNNIKCYLAELEGLISSASIIDTEIYLVTKSTLESKSKKADFAIVDDEGYFFQLVLVQSFPYDDIYLLYLAPINSL